MFIFYRNRFSDVITGWLKETTIFTSIASIGSDRYLGDIDCYVSNAIDCAKSEINSSDYLRLVSFQSFLDLFLMTKTITTAIIVIIAIITKAMIRINAKLLLSKIKTNCHKSYFSKKFFSEEGLDSYHHFHCLPVLSLRRFV